MQLSVAARTGIVIAVLATLNLALYLIDALLP